VYVAEGSAPVNGSFGSRYFSDWEIHHKYPRISSKPTPTARRHDPTPAHPIAPAALSLSLVACGSDNEDDMAGPDAGTGIPAEGEPLPLADLEGLYARTDVPDNAEMVFVTADGGLRFYTLDADIGNCHQLESF